MARPSKYDPKVTDKVIAFMKEGMSIEEICLELNICKQTFYNWCGKNKKLLDAKKTGEAFSQGWWMREGRKALRDKDFNHVLWYMNMKNRFGWQDRQQTDVTSGGEKISVKLHEPND